MTQTYTPPIAGATTTRRLGSWELMGVEAEGTLSRIYRAQAVGASDHRDAPYAVKILRDRWAGDAQAVAQFRREALVGRTVSHPHLISILASGLREPPYYLVMPRLEGRTLRARLDQGVHLDLPVALWIARQTAQALDALASAGWRHGDVKPSNLFLSSDQSHVTLLDLGFAQREGESCSAAERRILGTCNYIAPETITSALAADIRADIYSLGVVLFELLTGRLPFEGATLEALVIQHRQSPAPPLRRLAPHMPSEVAALVRRMLAKEPLRRPQTPHELVQELTNLEIQCFAARMW